MASFARRQTALSLISELMGALGLDVPTGVVGSIDTTVSQFLQLANDAGQQLTMDSYKWKELQSEMTIVTTPGVSTYDLPTDFDGFFDDASWNRTTRLPVVGSLTQAEWQMLKARLIAGTTFTVLFRVIGAQLEFYDEPTTAQTIVLPYQSRGWVRSASDARQDTILADDDVVLFDPQLFKTQIRCDWMGVKGFDTSRIERTLQRVRAAAQGNDAPGRTLSLAPGSDYPYLGQINVPDTGYGA